MKVIVGGRFNIIHPGHVEFLKKAKSLGNSLIVVIARDSTIKKNRDYMLFNEKERKKMLESIKYVDKVVIGYEVNSTEDYKKIINKEKPDIIALGYDQKMVKFPGIKTVRIKNYKGFKTRKLLRKFRGI